MISNIAAPTLEVFAPAQPNGTAMLIAAGGGLTGISQATEAYPAARWLTDQGITAFVLTYRLPGEGWSDPTPAPLQDGQRALRMIRAAAEQYRIDPARVGVLGFSAGGYVLGMVAVRSDCRSYAPVDAVDEQSARPDFAVLLYPVVTLGAPSDQTATARKQVGEHASREVRDTWSVQSYVRANDPPMFLAQAADDTTVSPQNTILLEAACREHGVPVEMHRFDAGGHGFGMGRPGTPSAAWPTLCRAWLDRQGVVR
ncbi:alpha/beta hydrolase [Methylobacterium sp. ARG-1]|uniref:alpha/beta hydrolase n=1 Tax=Methylobacterium sp. ARG-1 TaxID=1692501 RepID=UPI000AD976CF|nr:alpha/beta hydrolase [Methylobacterium sp. ARG-1]